MTVGATEITKLLDDLGKAKRPVFCSEMDFQIQLAWQMRICGWEVALEYDPECFSSNTAIDIFVYKPERVAVELKYKTLPHGCEFDGLRLCLNEQLAQDHGRHDFWKDISRLQTIVAAHQSVRGFAIFL